MTQGSKDPVEAPGALVRKAAEAYASEWGGNAGTQATILAEIMADFDAALSAAREEGRREGLREAAGVARIEAAKASKAARDYRWAGDDREAGHQMAAQCIGHEIAERIEALIGTDAPDPVITDREEAARALELEARNMRGRAQRMRAGGLDEDAAKAERWGAYYTEGARLVRGAPDPDPEEARPENAIWREGRAAGLREAAGVARAAGEDWTAKGYAEAGRWKDIYCSRGDGCSLAATAIEALLPKGAPDPNLDFDGDGERCLRCGKRWPDTMSMDAVVEACGGRRDS